MKNTLKNTIHFLTGWLSKPEKTKSISEVGSIDSTGNGSIKTNATDWTTIVIFIIFGFFMWLTPSPFNFGSRVATPIGIPVPGPTHYDTVMVLLPVFNDQDSTHSVQAIQIPQVTELVTDKDIPNAHVYFRSTAYTNVENDSVHVDLMHEYNIQVKAVEIIKTDSIPYPVEVPAEVPFIEKPIVVATGTVAIVLGIVYIIGSILK